MSKVCLFFKAASPYFDNNSISYNLIDTKINFTFGAAINSGESSLSFAKIALKEGKLKGRKKRWEYQKVK